MQGLRIFSLVVLVGVCLVSLPGAAAGQAYPDKPITIYCSYAPGATTDLTTRHLAEGAEKI